MSNYADLARRFFALDLPCTEDMLKSAFRRAAKQIHSDVGGSDAAFVEMKAAYDALCDAPQVVLTDHVDRRERTAEGVLLSDLGLGLGPTINGRDCPSCNHQGYTSIQHSYYEACAKCEGHGDIFLCRACHGTGQYTNPVHRRVPCNRCNAKGFKPAQKEPPYFQPKRARGAQGCDACQATGKTAVLVKKFTHRRCGECNGTGEIKIYNPVIMKSGLGTQKQRKQST